MTSFDRREEAFEAAFAHQQELGFKARARAMRDLALWAAERMGKSPDAAQHYVDDIMLTRLREGDDTAIQARIARDLAAAGCPENQHAVARRAALLLTAATKAVGGEEAAQPDAR